MSRRGDESSRPATNECSSSINGFIEPDSTLSTRARLKLKTLGTWLLTEKVGCRKSKNPLSGKPSNLVGGERNTLFRRAVLLASLAVFIGCGWKLAALMAGYSDNRAAAAEAKALYDQGAAAEASRLFDSAAAAEAVYAEQTAAAALSGTGSVPAARQRFEPLIAVNPDIAGWLRIGGTAVDYPLVRGGDNDFYLTHNYRRKTSSAGAIFIDFRNGDPDGDRNTVIYGHRMKDNSMFGELKKYGDVAFFNGHRTFDYDTLYAGYKVEVFSVYYTTSQFDYIRTQFDGDDDYARFLQEIREKSMYTVDTPLSVDDRIVTLSTCDYTVDAEEGRLAVHGKLVPRR